MAVEGAVNPSATSPHSSPAAMFGDESAVWRELISLLDEEQAALRQADAMKLPRLAAAKQRRITLLQQFEQERTARLRAAGYGGGPSAMDDWLAAQETSAAQRQSWVELRQLARDAQRMNQLNGRLIAQQRRHFDQALHALISAAGTAGLYGADGMPRQLTPPHRGTTAG